MKLNQFGDTVRLAILGLGCRGVGQMKVLLDMPDVQIAAVCDAYADRVETAREIVREAKGNVPFGSTDPIECIRRDDVDAVVVMTGWETHIPLCIQALRAGKHVAMEVGGATSVDECWQLVHASEETGIPVMLLENCCYGETELTLLKMIHENVFGTVVHCAGAYSHDLRDEIGNGDINRGNRMLTLTSMASKACGMHEWLVKNRPDSPLVNVSFNEGDVVTTMIRCANGETILLTHDCTLPRPYSRGGVVRGTKGMWMEDGRSIYLEGITPHDENDWAHHPESDGKYMEQYRHPLWKEYREFGVRGNHDGMDYLVLRAFIESVQNQTEPPIDAYDAAAWMSITALSEQSIALGSAPVAIPDFTGGRWCLPRNNPARGEFDA